MQATDNLLAQINYSHVIKLLSMASYSLIQCATTFFIRVWVTLIRVHGCSCWHFMAKINKPSKTLFTVIITGVFFVYVFA